PNCLCTSIVAPIIFFEISFSVIDLFFSTKSQSQSFSVTPWLMFISCPVGTRNSFSVHLPQGTECTEYLCVLCDSVVDVYSFFRLVPVSLSVCLPQRHRVHSVSLCTL